MLVHRAVASVPLALLIILSVSAAQAQEVPALVRPFQPLAELMDDVSTGFRNAGRLKQEVVAATKKLKNDRKTYLADRDRVSRLRKAVENAKQMIAGTNRKWLCSRYNTLHDMPSQCSDPQSGGVWVIVDAGGRTRRWTAPTQAEIDATARAAAALEMLEGKLAQAKDRLDADERTLRDDTDRYNRLVDDLRVKTDKLGDPKRVLDDIARAAARSGTADEATTRQINALDKMLGKVIGSGQCVELVKQYAGLGATGTWQPDGAVGRAAPVIPFAPIATFEGVKYVSNPKGNHAAIVLERTSNGLLVFDQYSGKKGGMRVIRNKGGTAANQADIDRGEAEAAAKGLTEANGLAYFQLKYKYYSPSDDADNYSYIQRPDSSR